MMQSPGHLFGAYRSRPTIVDNENDYVKELLLLLLLLPKIRQLSASVLIPFSTPSHVKMKKLFEMRERESKKEIKKGERGRRRDQRSLNNSMRPWRVMTSMGEGRRFRHGPTGNTIKKARHRAEHSTSIRRRRRRRAYPTGSSE